MNASLQFMRDKWTKIFLKKTTNLISINKRFRGFNPPEFFLFFKTFHDQNHAPCPPSLGTMNHEPQKLQKYEVILSRCIVAADPEEAAWQALELSKDEETYLVDIKPYVEQSLLSE